MVRSSQQSLVWSSMALRMALLLAVPTVAPGQDGPAPSPASRRLELPTNVQREARLAAALDKRLDADFVETPLKDVVTFLSVQSGVSIELDRRGIEAQGIGTETPVTFQAKDLPLRSILNLMLLPNDLTWSLETDRLVVTSWERAGRWIATSVWAVAEFVPPDSPHSPQLMSELRYAIMDHAGFPRTRWDEAGGFGSVDVTLEGALIVSSTWRVREDAQQLVDTLRQVMRAPADNPQDPLAALPCPDILRHEPLRRRLQTVASFDFSEAPLRDVLEFLGQRQGLTIRLDKQEIEAAGFGTETPVTASAKDVSLDRALKKVLADFDLTYVLDDDVVLVTSRDQENQRSRWVVYPLPDFCPGDDLDETFLQLAYVAKQIDMHLAQLAPGWDRYGGVGRISPLPIAKSLVITTTDEVHEQVRRLIAHLRAKRTQPQPRVPAIYESRSYRITAAKTAAPVDPKALVLLITEALPEEAWKQRPLVVGDQLIVHQTPVGHLKIRRLLKVLDLPVTPPNRSQNEWCGSVIRPWPF